MKKDNCQKLFELVDSIGETLEGDLHILDNTEYPRCEDEKKYRIYHKNGYCIDVMKEIEDEDENTGEITYYYDFFAEWEGFDKIDVDKSIILITPYGKRNNTNRKSVKAI